jgi:hypothetical protein
MTLLGPFNLSTVEMQVANSDLFAITVSGLSGLCTSNDKGSDPPPGCGPGEGCQVAGSAEPLDLTGNKGAKLIFILKDIQLNSTYVVFIFI